MSYWRRAARDGPAELAVRDELGVGVEDRVGAQAGLEDVGPAPGGSRRTWSGGRGCARASRRWPASRVTPSGGPVVLGPAPESRASRRAAPTRARSAAPPAAVIAAAGARSADQGPGARDRGRDPLGRDDARDARPGSARSPGSCRQGCPPRAGRRPQQRGRGARGRKPGCVAPGSLGPRRPAARPAPPQRAG